MSDKYNSKIAAFVGWLNGAKFGYAVTISETCTLYSVPEDKVSERWSRHEYAHKRQIEALGWFSFMTKYLISLKNEGYWNSKFEVEARAAEGKDV